MALSEIPRRLEAAPRYVRLRNADMESRLMLEEYNTDPTLIKFGEPIAVPKVVFDASSVDYSLVPKPKSNKRISERRAAIIHTILANPSEEATPYWTEFIDRNFERISRFARTAVNKGLNIDPTFK